MKFERIVFGLGAIIGLLLFRQAKPILLKIIIIGLALCAGLPFLDDYININVGFFSFGALTLGFTIWCGIEGKWTSMIIGLFAFLSFTWSYMNFSFWAELQFLMIIPLVCYCMILKKNKDYRNELGVLTTITSFELTEFILFLSRITI